MPITAICPECGEKHFVNPDLRGKRMVCKNTVCRSPFVVTDGQPPTPTPEPEPTTDGWWKEAPPVRTQAPIPTPTPTPTPAPSKKTASSAGKRTATATPKLPTSTNTPVVPPTIPTLVPKPKPEPGRWLTRVLVLFLIAVPVILGGVGYWAITVFAQTEEKLANQAMAALKTGKFASAAGDFASVAEKFPASEQVSKYRTYEKLARELSNLDYTGTALDQPLLGLEKYLDSKESRDPLVEPFRPEIGKAVERLVKGFAGRVLPATDDSPLRHVDKADEIIERLRDLKPALTPAQSEALLKTTASVRDAVKSWQTRDLLIRRLTELAEQGTADALKQFRRMIERNRAAFPRLAEESRDLLDRLLRKHLASVVYSEASAVVVEPPAPPVRDPARNLFVSAVVKKPAKDDLRQTDDIVLALARGVLYALRQADGTVAWARRVGIDTTLLPVRVRGDALNSDRILVLSADSKTLTALDHQGRLIWVHPLDEPCLGRPVVVGDRAYLATTRGKVREVELTRGRLLGWFDLGQSLSLGGVREKGQSRIVFAADDGCVYVLDVAPNQHRCVAVLYSGHDAGELRAAPILLPGYGQGKSGYLVLTVARGLDHTGLRVFHLPHWQETNTELRLDRPPLAGSDFWMLPETPGLDPVQAAWPAGDHSVRPDVSFPGWTWFPPAVDPEKMAFVSEVGWLGLVGINQSGTRNALLFPLLAGDREGIDLRKFLHEGVAGQDTNLPLGRAQVVRMQGETLWLLAGGRLQRGQLGWDALKGPQLMPAWKAPLNLGGPLHLSQALPDPRHALGIVRQDAGDDPTDADSTEGRAILFVTTQPLDRPGALVSAIEDETGRILWQTQLGLVAVSDPLLLRPQAGQPGLLIQDQTGALHLLPAEQSLAEKDSEWRGIEPLLADGFADNPRWAPRLVRLDESTAVQVAAPGPGTTLLLRVVSRDAAANRWAVTTHQLPLAKPLAGPPDRVGGHLVIPLADGNLVRVPIPPGDNPILRAGSTWRERFLGPSASGLVRSLGGDRFVTSDGGEGLTVWDWPAADNLPKPLPPNLPIVAGRRQPTYRLSAPLAGEPLILPAQPGEKPRLLVPDRSRHLTLLEAQDDGSLKVVRIWPLPGRAIDGPYIASGPEQPLRVCLVLSDQRLVWLDPGSDSPAVWNPVPPGEAILGQPRQHGDAILLATEAGRVLALDPTTGRPLPWKHELKGSIAPATAPIPVGAGVLLLPLSDGTLMLVPGK